MKFSRGQKVRLIETGTEHVVSGILKAKDGLIHYSFDDLNEKGIDENGGEFIENEIYYPEHLLEAVA